MKIGMLGTGIVGRTLATALLDKGHQVTMGSRGNPGPEALAWAESGGEAAQLSTFADAARFGDLLVNATSGSGTLAALGSCDNAGLDGKVLIDVSNPLDFSAGFPPVLAILNDDSLAEQVQAAHPGARVVKTFNTMSAPVMADPKLVPGHHNVFLSGNDPEAKAKVAALQQEMGWPAEDIIDLGDLSTARGTEMYLPLWLRLYGVVGNPHFNIHVTRG